MRARDNGGSARVVHDQAKSQKVTLSWAAMRPDRRPGAGRDCAEGTADGTQIVPFGVPGDRASGASRLGLHPPQTARVARTGHERLSGCAAVAAAR